jgi:hypothetical protein
MTEIKTAVKSALLAVTMRLKLLASISSSVMLLERIRSLMLKLVSLLEKLQKIF